MGIKYPYTSTTALNTKGQIVKRPILEIGFPGTKFTGLGLLDSGADNVMLNIDYAKIIGVDLEKCPKRKFRGIGDREIDCYISEAVLKIQHFDKIKIPVAFIDSKNVNILIGKECFFDTFKVKFEKNINTFELTKVKK